MAIYRGGHVDSLNYKNIIEEGHHFYAFHSLGGILRGFNILEGQQAEDVKSQSAHRVATAAFWCTFPMMEKFA
jgi:hypothetical protein